MLNGMVKIDVAIAGRFNFANTSLSTRRKVETSSKQHQAELQHWSVFHTVANPFAAIQMLLRSLLLSLFSFFFSFSSDAHGHPTPSAIYIFFSINFLLFLFFFFFLVFSECVALHFIWTRCGHQLTFTIPLGGNEWMTDVLLLQLRTFI